MKSAIFLITGVVVMVGVAGCVKPVQPTTTPPTTPLAKTASPTPSYTDGEKTAIERAITYYQTIISLHKDQSLSIDKLYETSRDKGYGYGYSVVRGARERGEKGVGESTIRLARLAPVDYETKIVNLCVDNTKLDFVDQNGKSIIPSGSNRRTVRELTMSYQDGQWWVTGVEYKGETC